MESKVLAETAPQDHPARRKRRLPTELSIFLVLVGIALVY
jgi:hypothetical protein